MQIYSDYPLARSRQVAADVIAVLIVAASIALGFAAGVSIAAFGELSRRVQDAGSRFESTMSDAAGVLSRIPLVGAQARQPFDSASSAGTSLSAAGADGQSAIATASVIVGIVVACVPIAIVLRIWLVRRIGFVRRAAAARKMLGQAGGTDILALRALSTLDPALLLRLGGEPAAAWRRGDPEVVRELAAMALRETGVRPR